MGRRRPTVPMLHKEGSQHREHRTKKTRKPDYHYWKIGHDIKKTKIGKLKLEEIENEIINPAGENDIRDEIRNN